MNHRPASPFRRAAASFWLKALFRVTQAAPGLVGRIRSPVAYAAWCFSRHIRDHTSDNAAHIFPTPLSTSQRRSFGLGVTRSFYDFVRDMGLSLKADRQQLLARIEAVHGLETYQATRSHGKGAVILTAHMGSFEVGLAALSQYESRIHVVFKRDRHEVFERLRADLRKRLNVQEAAIDDGWPIWMRLRDALVNNEVVALQGDRVLPPQKGAAMPLLGGKVVLPTGPIKLALAAGSPIIPIFSIRGGGDRVRIYIEQPIMVDAGLDEQVIPAAMRQWAQVLGRYIGRYPDQWLVLEKAFCEDAA